MADWNVLNKEFNDLIDNFTPEDWEKWEKEREIKKLSRRKKLKEDGCRIGKLISSKSDRKQEF